MIKIAKDWAWMDQTCSGLLGYAKNQLFLETLQSRLVSRVQAEPFSTFEIFGSDEIVQSSKWSDR